MAQAICLHCGAWKPQPFTRCQRCAWRPDDDDSLTRQNLISTRFRTPAELEDVAADIKAGRAIEFHPDELIIAWVTVDQIRGKSRSRGTCRLLGAVNSGVRSALDLVHQTLRTRT